MKNIHLLYLTLLFFLFEFSASSQNLKPGFNAEEYIEMLRISAQQMDSLLPNQVPFPELFHREYRSPETGLKNRWDLWVNKDHSLMVVSLRGTTRDFSSWLENFYCAMVPAKGKLQLNDSTTIEYKFANDPKAAVHVGWALGICSMLPDIVAKVKEYYNNGTKQLIIMGHSQGGAMAYLLSSSFYYLVHEDKLPHDLVVKTYCSGAPKPGNLFYAYDYDYITREGWEFTIVNAADWVPETPFSIQTIEDMSPVNPFVHNRKSATKQPLFIRLYINHVYGKLDGSTTNARYQFKKYLGTDAYKQVKKYLPQFREPLYYPSMNYSRAGTPVVLQPNEEYYKRFPDTSDHVFIHHLFDPYVMLINTIYLKKPAH